MIKVLEEHSPSSNNISQAKNCFTYQLHCPWELFLHYNIYHNRKDKHKSYLCNQYVCCTCKYIYKKSQSYLTDSLFNKGCPKINTRFELNKIHSFLKFCCCYFSYCKVHKIGLGMRNNTFCLIHKFDVPGLLPTLSRISQIQTFERLVFGRPVCLAPPIDTVCLNFSLTLFTVNEVISQFRPNFVRNFLIVATKL